MDWQVIIGLLTLLGGWDAVKYFLNRRANKQLALSEADSAAIQARTDEFHALREYNEFLQSQLLQNQKLYYEQETRARTYKERELELLKENCELKLELATKRCERKRCATREPQNGY